MFLDVLQILRRPVVTERTTLLRGQNKFVFEVNPAATKGQIREAVEAAFKVDVLAVNTMKVRGKTRRRFGPRSGQEPCWKKAVVTLRAGQEIKYAEPTA